MMDGGMTGIRNEIFGGLVPVCVGDVTVGGGDL